MKRIFKIIGVLFFLIGLLGCTSAGGESPAGPLHYLALGDSYTIGEAVYAPNRWPTVLAGMLESEIGAPFVVEYRARTGWTTGNLLASLEATPPERDGYDLVSLLIGVNNQFRGYPFATYRSEVPGSSTWRWSTPAEILIGSLWSPFPTTPIPLTAPTSAPPTGRGSAGRSTSIMHGWRSIAHPGESPFSA
jgi:hypothetical protein